MWKILIREFIYDLKNQKTRVFLTVFSVIWGTMSICLLLAFGFGLEKRLTEGNLSFRDATISVYSGETSKIYQGPGYQVQALRHRVPPGESTAGRHDQPELRPFVQGPPWRNEDHDIRRGRGPRFHAYAADAAPAGGAVPE